MSTNKLQQAITRLARLGPFWSLLADMDPEQFLANVADEILRLRDSNKRLRDLLGEYFSTVDANMALEEWNTKAWKALCAEEQAAKAHGSLDRMQE